MQFKLKLTCVCYSQFIVHKNCQQVLQNIWTLEHPNIMWMPLALRLLYFIPHLLLLPFVYLIYFFAPCAPFLTYWKAPMNKFLGDLVSYFTFIGLLFYTIVNSDVSVMCETTSFLLSVAYIKNTI